MSKHITFLITLVLAIGFNSTNSLINTATALNTKSLVNKFRGSVCLIFPILSRVPLIIP